MHWFGKTCAWLVVIAAGAALGLSVKLLNYRGEWLKQANTLKVANAASAEKFGKSQKDLAAAESELSRELIRWERYWSDKQGAFVVEGENALLQAEVGTTQKLTADANVQPEIYAFMLAADGASSYVGPFQVQQTGENQATMRPAFRVRNPQQFAAATKWRFRSMIPDADKARFLDLESQLLVADERLRKEEGNLAAQIQLVETAKQHRDFRLAELLGGDNVPEGLVAKIAKAEEERNTAQTEVDRLRRDVSDAIKHLQELAAKNKELVSKLASRLLKGTSETADAGQN